ncbi:hypothetical protein MMC13_004371 [Lambiella insularis]|nr:hypothetical protein [Lambiella insularis]
MFLSLQNTYWISAFLYFLFFDKITADSCGTPPLLLPITNYTLADGVALNRGVGVQVGSQILGLRLSTRLANTRLRNADDCQQGNASIETQCAGSTGSIFDLTKSKTWSQAGPGGWNVSAIDPHEAGESIVDGWDMAKLFSTSSVPGFPMEVWSNAASDNRSGLAIGPNSSFLEWLSSASLVPSKVLGIYFGSRSQLEGADCLMTIGGIDKSRLNGPFTNFSTQADYVVAPCPLQVLVSDIRLNNANGSFSLLADSEATVAACIDPLQNSFTLTPSMYAQLAMVINQSNTSYNGIPTDPASSEPLLGNLSITLSNGFQTTIPHYELVSQMRGSSSTGAYTIVDPTRITTALGSTANTTTPILGGVFLSQLYLMIDYKNQMFGLAPAVVENLGSQKAEVIPVCNATMTASSGPVATKSNVGAIAGGVVGGVLGLLLLYAIALCVWRRLRHVAQKPDPSTAVSFPTADLETIVARPPMLELDSEHGVSQAADREPGELYERW